jgi:uncharacterized protein with beta-barrel porin domain
LSFDFKLPKIPERQRSKSQRKNLKSIKGNCKGRNKNKHCAEISESAKNNKSDLVYSENKKIHQLISASGSNNREKNRRSSSSVARIENIGPTKLKKVSVEGQSVEGNDNVVQTETSTIDESNNTNLISLTRVEGDQAAKSSLDTVGSLEDDGSVKVDFDIANEVEGDQKSSLSLIGKDEIQSSLFMDIPQIEEVSKFYLIICITD